MKLSLVFTFLGYLIGPSLATMAPSFEAQWADPSENSLSEQAKLLQKTSRNLQACVDLGCAAREMASDAKRFAAIRAALENDLSPLTDLFNNFFDANRKVKAVNNILPIVEGALKVASKIPKVGPLFVAASKVIGLWGSPMRALEDATDGAVIIFRPYVTAVNTLLENLESIEQKLISSIDGIGGLHGLVGRQCARETISLIAPTFDPAYNALEDVVLEVHRTVSDLVSLLGLLDEALGSLSWRNVKASVEEVVAGVDRFYSPLDVLEPLGDLLESEINIPFPVIEFKHNDGIPDDCPPGYEKWGLNCVRECPNGYHNGAEPFQCYRDCPGGFTDTGLACSDVYVRNVNVFRRRELFFGDIIEDVEDTFGGAVGGAFSCRSGWDNTGPFTCVKRCRGGYKNFDIVPLSCAKRCPAGWSSDPTGTQCFKPTWNRGTPLAYQCRNGYDFIEGFCLKKCPGGSTDLRYSCLTTIDTTIRITDIADAFEDILEDVGDLPIIREVENAIESAITAVLGPLFDALGLPSVDFIPDFPDLGNILPLSEVEEIVEDLEIPSASGIVDFGSIEQGIQALLSDFSLPGFSEIADCASDRQCILDSMGVDSVDIPDDFIASVADQISDQDWNAAEEAIVDMLTSVKGCSETTSAGVPISDTLAHVMGIGQNEAPSCNMNVDVCTQLEFDDNDVFKRTTSILETSFEPLFGLIDELIERDQARRGLGIDFSLQRNGRDFKFALPFSGKLIRRIPILGQLCASEGSRHDAILGSVRSTFKATCGLDFVLGRLDGEFFFRIETSVGIGVDVKRVGGSPRQRLTAHTKRLQDRITEAADIGCAEQDCDSVANEEDAGLEDPLLVNEGDGCECKTAPLLEKYGAYAGTHKFLEGEDTVLDLVTKYPADSTFWERHGSAELVSKYVTALEKAVAEFDEAIRLDRDAADKQPRGATLRDMVKESFTKLVSGFSFQVAFIEGWGVNNGAAVGINLGLFDSHVLSATKPFFQTTFGMSGVALDGLFTTSPDTGLIRRNPDFGHPVLGKPQLSGVTFNVDLTRLDEGLELAGANDVSVGFDVGGTFLLFDSSSIVDDGSPQPPSNRKNLRG